MEKNILLEISRIKQLMGTNLLVEGPVTWIDDIFRLYPKFFYNFKSIVDDFYRSGSKFTDDEIDKMVDNIKATGVIDEVEAAEIKSLIKNEKLFRESLEEGGDLLENLRKKYKDVPTVPTISDAMLKKLSVLTTKQLSDIANFSKTKLKSIFDDVKSSLSMGVSMTEDMVIETLDNISLNNQTINSVEDFYNAIDEKVLDFVDNNITAGLFPENHRKLIFDEFSERMRNSSKVSSKIDELKGKGLIKDNPPLTTRPTYNSKRLPKEDKLPFSKYVDNTKVKGSETPNPSVETPNSIVDNSTDVPKITRSQRRKVGFGFETVELPENVSKMYNDIKNKIKNNQPLTEAESKFKESVDAWIEGSDEVYDWNRLIDEINYNPEDWVNFGKNFQAIAKKYSWFKKFYIKVFRPLYRWWLSVAESMWANLGKNADEVFQGAKDDFTEAMQTGFNEFLERGKKAKPNDGFKDTAYMSEIKDKLIKLKNAGTPKNALDLGYLTHKEMWNHFVTNARKKLTGLELEQFNKFITIVENESKDGFFSVSMKEIFNDGLDEVGEAVGKDGGKLDANKVFEDGMKKLKELPSQLGTVSIIENLVKGFIGYIKNFISLILTGSFATPRDAQLYFIKNGFTKKSTSAFFLKRFFYAKILTPIIGGVVGAVWAGDLRRRGIKNENLDGEHGMAYNLTYSLLLDPMSEALFGDGPLRKTLDWWTGKSIPSSWTNYLGSALPGYTDDSLYEIIDRIYASTLGGGEDTKTVVEKESIEKINDSSEKNYKRIQNIKDETLRNQKLLDFKDDTADYDYIEKTIKTDENDILTPEESKFIYSRLTFIPKIPGDYYKKLNEKRKDLEGSVEPEDVEQFNSITSIINATNSGGEEVKKQIENFSLGSAVLKGKSGKYYVVLSPNRKLPTVTDDDIAKHFNNDVVDVKWVMPSFDELNNNSKRDYYNLKQFYDNYNKL